MKKFKSLVLAVIGLLCSISVSAHQFEVGGIYYNITSSTDMTVEVTYRGNDYFYWDEYSGAVNIPELVTYNGNTYSVTSIGDYAFFVCSGLTSVVIPNSVTSIGFWAFRDCSSLTSVVIPNSVTSIGGDAFSDTAWYNNKPNGVVYLDNYLLDYKGTMPYNTSIKIKEGTLLIADRAFDGCSGLTSVVIPNGVTSIGGEAFSSCSSLTSVEIPNSVTSIGDEAFYGCSNLRVVLNNSNLTFTKGSSSYGYIAYYAYVVCNGYEQVDDFIFTDENHANYLRAYIGNATELVLPTNYKGGNYGIGSSAFYDCSHLTSVVIPNSVTSIGDYAFYDCSSLTSGEIPNSVTSIGSSAFRACSSLTSLTIGTGVLSIGSNQCTPKKTIWLPNSPFR